MTNRDLWDCVKEAEDKYFVTLEEKLAIIQEHDPHAKGTLPVQVYIFVKELEARQETLYFDLVNVIMQFSDQNPKLSPRDIEDRFRKENRHIYFFARPFQKWKLDSDTSLFFGGKERPCKYELSVLVTKDQGFYIRDMRNCGSSSTEENREKLERSGVIRAQNDVKCSVTNLYGPGEVFLERTYMCMNCEKIMSKSETKRCSACHKVRYCSKQCQRTHWSNHRKTCHK